MHAQQTVIVTLLCWCRRLMKENGVFLAKTSADFNTCFHIRLAWTAHHTGRRSGGRAEKQSALVETAEPASAPLNLIAGAVGEGSVRRLMSFLLRWDSHFSRSRKNAGLSQIEQIDRRCKQAPAFLDKKALAGELSSSATACLKLHAL